MNVLVIDGQGGGLGRQLVAALSAQCPDIRLVAVGTNSVAAQAMHKAGAQRAADAGETVAAVGEQGVDERAVLVAGRGVHDHAARFVYYQQVVILVHDVDRDILRPELCVGGLWHDEHDLLAG